MPRNDQQYELIPFDDTALPIRLNADSVVQPGKISFSPELCLWHEQLELLIPREGMLSVFIGKSNYQAFPGELVLVNPYEPHLVVSCGEPSKYDCLMIDGSLYRKAAQGTDSAKLLELLSDGHVRFENLIRADAGLNAHTDGICRELRTRGAAFDLSVKAHVISLLVGLFRRHLSGNATPEQIAANAARYDRIRPAVELIKSDMSRRPSLEELSEACHLSPSHFCRLFRQITGCSPLQFDTDLRIREAAALLRQTDMSVSQIALSVGFDDAGYFSRCFKRRLGTTPTRARGTAGK